MTEDKKRALRRCHTARLKRNRTTCYANLALEVPAHKRSRLLGIYATTMPVCSCWMCGNPRRHFGEKTLPERRFEAIGKDSE